MVTYRDLQTNLMRAGYDPQGIDGKWGKCTLAALMAYMAGVRITDRIRDLAAEMAVQMPRYQINTPLRILHFLAQAAHETDRWRTLQEYWGPTAAQAGYEGRADLGNTQPGDGKRYLGRGVFQSTGRANYTDLARRTGLDLVAHPELAAAVSNAVLTACIFWDVHTLSGQSLNSLADADNIKAVTRVINGGQNGITDRVAILARGKSVWGV